MVVARTVDNGECRCRHCGACTSDDAGVSADVHLGWGVYTATPSLCVPVLVHLADSSTLEGVSSVVCGVCNNMFALCVEQVRQAEFERQIDAFSVQLARTHVAIRASRAVPLALIGLGVIFCVLAVIVMTTDDESAALWPILVGVPLLTVGAIGLWVVRWRAQSLVDRCVERLQAHCTRLNDGGYRAAGMKWAVSAHAMVVDRKGTATSVKLPMVELAVSCDPSFDAAFVDGGGSAAGFALADGLSVDGSGDEASAEGGLALAPNPLLSQQSARRSNRHAAGETWAGADTDDSSIV